MGISNIISGDFGSVAGISSVLSFSLSENRETKSYKASNTAGATGRNKGIFGFSGTYSALGAIPQLMPKDIVVAQQFFLGPDDGVYNPTTMKGTIYTGDIIIDQVVVNWNWETQDPMMHTVSFTGIGPLSRAYDADFTPDTTAVNVNDVCPTKIEISDAAATEFFELENLTSAALTFTAANTQYANSNTNCAKESLPGGIDFTLGMSRQETMQQVLNVGGPNTTLEIDSGVDYQLRMYTDAALFWLLKWAIMKDHTNIQGDIQSSPSTIVGFDKSFEMQAFNGGLTGQIVFPGGTPVWWPTPTP